MVPIDSKITLITLQLLGLSMEDPSVKSCTQLFQV